MPTPKKGMTKQKLETAELLGRGDMTDVAICEKIGICVATLWKWERDDEFVQAILSASDRYLASIVPKARGKLSQQMGEDGKWLGQSAANSLLREHQANKGMGAQQIVVTFGGIEPGQVSNVDTKLPE